LLLFFCYTVIRLIRPWLVQRIRISTSHYCKGGDNGELLAAACAHGVAHPPGYPLYMMLLQFFMYVIPIGAPAWRAGISSAMLGASSSFFITLTVQRWNHNTISGY